MLCGSLKSNGLADPFKNNEDDTFPEEQLPPPLQEHDAPSADHPTRKGRQSEKPANGDLNHAAHPARYQHAAQMQQQAMLQQAPFPSYFDMWPAHAAAMSQAFGASGMGVAGMGNAEQNGAAAAAAAAFQTSMNMSAHQLAGLPLPQAGMHPATAAAKLAAVSSPSLQADTCRGAGLLSLGPAPSAVATAAAAAPPSQEAGPSSEAEQPPLTALTASMMVPQSSTAVGTTGIMHRPLLYPNVPGGTPSLFHTGLAPAATQAAASSAALISSGFPSSFPFPLNMPTLDANGNGTYPSAAADASRLSQLGLYGQHLPAFAHAAHTAGMGNFLPTPFAVNSHQGPVKSESTAAASAAADQGGLPSAAAGIAGEAGRKRKSPGSSQKRGARAGGAGGDAGGAVIARRAANRPPPQVKALP